MKSKELIERIQKLDPTGEWEVFGWCDSMLQKYYPPAYRPETPQKITRKDFHVGIYFVDDRYYISFNYLDNDKKYDWYYEYNECKLRELYYTNDSDDWEDDLWEDMWEYIVIPHFTESCENYYETDYVDDQLEELKTFLLDCGFRSVSVE